MIKVKLKPIVGGNATGEVVKVERLSFYGEVDPEKGILVADGREVKDKILIIGMSRGSTVGSYIIYGLKYYGNAPKAIIMIKSEPIVITGAVIAGIPLYEALPREVFDMLSDGDEVEVDEQGNLIIKKASRLKER
ncbi:MAG: DUF126 domain-containing protein [Desulfurococcales archaeon]|nr:DUF126 domain-containing protein [Desulfurococcales archaeon]